MSNGTDVVKVNAKIKKEIRQQYGLNGHPVLLYVGQMNWKKNIRCILLAAALLDTDYRLVLAGAGPHEKEISALAQELGIADNVILTGFISDTSVKMALYSNADLFVFPSLYDTFGLVVREAAAVGTPSITVRKSGAAEGIKNGENGFLCKDDPVDLAKVIRAALDNNNLRKTVGDNAKKTLPVPWDKVTDSVLARYQYVISHTRKR